MNHAVLLLGLLVGAPTVPAPRPRPRVSPADVRLLARFVVDPSGFNPSFGKGDPAAHAVRFGGPVVGVAPGVGATARDKALEAALFRPRATTSLQMSWPLK